MLVCAKQCNFLIQKVSVKPTTKITSNKNQTNLMDFDTAKENIQPLRQGRRADRLEAALSENKELLEQEKT
jgi:hypothetical protein